MDQQLIISIGREYGSGGHEIAEALAKRFNLEFYDKNILEKIAEEQQVCSTHLKRYDEAPKFPWLSRTVRGYSNSVEENIAELQFEYLRRKAREKESFVVVGRCAEEVLKDCPALISIFVIGRLETKCERIMRIQNVSAESAKMIISRNDRKRKMYHNYYCQNKWGDSRGYDLSISTSTAGVERTKDILEQYIRAIIDCRQRSMLNV
ncbi:MAG: cytidylate kinase-like family protein [Eubacteriales bacterium]|nr:cytidylate kinase-like family protein [Eubacteriales bacterium]